jgi:hypothetical protein
MLGKGRFLEGYAGKRKNSQPIKYQKRLAPDTRTKWEYAPDLTKVERDRMLDRHINAPSLRRLSMALKMGSENNGMYLTQPGTTLRQTWAAHLNHPLDILQASIDTMTEERIQNVPHVKGQLIIPGVEDCFLSKHFCRLWWKTCYDTFVREVHVVKRVVVNKKLELCRKACRNWWIFVLYKRRQEKEHKRIADIMNKLNSEKDYKFKQWVATMIQEWHNVARESAEHYRWQVSLYRLSWNMKTWKEKTMLSKWAKTKAVRLFRQLNKSIQKWSRVEKCRRFITWKENAEKMSIKLYRDWRHKTIRALFYRWQRNAEDQKVKRERVAYAMSRLPLAFEVEEDEKAVQPTTAAAVVEALEKVVAMDMSSLSVETFGPGAIELGKKIRRRVQLAHFRLWYDNMRHIRKQRIEYRKSFFCRCTHCEFADSVPEAPVKKNPTKRIIKGILKKSNRRTKTWKKPRKKLPHCHSCHTSSCAVPCPPTCLYLVEKKRMRENWEFIKI